MKKFFKFLLIFFVCILFLFIVSIGFVILSIVFSTELNTESNKINEKKTSIISNEELNDELNIVFRYNNQYDLHLNEYFEIKKYDGSLYKKPVKNKNISNRLEINTDSLENEINNQLKNKGKEFSKVRYLTIYELKDGGKHLEIAVDMNLNDTNMAFYEIEKNMLRLLPYFKETSTFNSYSIRLFGKAYNPSRGEVGHYPLIKSDFYLDDLNKHENINLMFLEDILDLSNHSVLLYDFLTGSYDPVNIRYIHGSEN